jgi:hypothetical protein
MRSWLRNAFLILDRLTLFLVRTLRLASGAGRRPRHPHGQGVPPLDPESPHAYWQLQNRAVSAPLAWRPAGGTGVLRCTASLGRLVLRASCDFMVSMALQCANYELLISNNEFAPDP